MVTFQFVKMSKGQNRLPWVYSRGHIGCNIFFRWVSERTNIMRLGITASSEVTASGSDSCQKTHIGCNKSETCLSREIFNKHVLISDMYIEFLKINLFIIVANKICLFIKTNNID